MTRLGFNPKQSAHASYQTMKSRIPIGVIVRATDKESWATLHLCRDIEEAHLTSQSAGEDRRDASQTAHIKVCAFDVPANLSIPEFLAFVAPMQSRVRNYQFIRAVSPGIFMVVIKFANVQAVDDYCEYFKGRRFNTSESNHCQVVRVGTIKANPLLCVPFASGDVQEHEETGSSKETGQSRWTTLREEDHSCPVCLERMDEKLTPLLTTFCQHTFHVNCLSKWGDGSCPVCRYSQRTPAAAESSDFKSQLADTDDDEEDDNACNTCGSTDNLSICLICGHVGCGPRQQAHAYTHYMNTDHIYALEMDTQRAWDFAGSGYVHRLIQNAVDGKLVELPGPSDDVESSTSQAKTEKMDAMALEYTYLLTSQLESQRAYYEDRMEELTLQLADLMVKADELSAKTRLEHADQGELQDRNCHLKRVVVEARKNKTKLERQLAVQIEKCKSARRALEEEKEMAESLKRNKDLLQITVSKQEKEMEDLNDKVQELMLALGGS